MVVGHGQKPPVPHDIKSAVADVRHVYSVRLKQGSGQGGPHASQRRVRLAHGQQPLMGEANRRVQLCGGVAGFHLRRRRVVGRLRL